MMLALYKNMVVSSIFIALIICLIGFLYIERQEMKYMPLFQTKHYLDETLKQNEMDTSPQNAQKLQMIDYDTTLYSNTFYGLLTLLGLTFFVFFRQLQHHLQANKRQSDDLSSSHLALEQKTKQQEQEIQSHQVLLKLTEKVPTILFQLEMDSAGKMSFPFLSKGLENILPKELIPKIADNGELGFCMVHHEDVSELTRSLKYSYQHLTEWNIEYRNVFGEEIRWFKGVAKPEAKGEGLVAWYGYLEDITERKLNEQILLQLNEQLNQRADELADSNAELEKFAYIASHDLQEPLRVITSFLELLEQDCGENISDEGKQYLNFATDGAARMKRIIQDLLEYSKMGRKGYQIEEIRVEDVLNEIMMLNNVLIQEKNAIIEWENMPIIQGGKTPIQQVFHNLVGNALKYQKKGELPRIKISAKEEDKHWQFSVADNGIGIEEKHFDKIFVIFQRLHRQKEFEGTGIGLAICKKIVENHRGEMWIESKKGEGSTFYFTIPKQ